MRRRGAWASALAAADFDAALVRPSRRVDDALEAAADEVTFFGAEVCDNALPAALLALDDVDGFRSTEDALDAALLPVSLDISPLKNEFIGHNVRFLPYQFSENTHVQKNALVAQVDALNYIFMHE